jgi:heme-degrading monooxygenase HmoA
MLIARAWHGITMEKCADEYLRYIEETAIPACRDIPGNVGALVLRRVASGVAEFFVLSVWESYEAISRFTGSKDISKPVYHEEDYKYLCFPETHVVHYQLAVGSDRFCKEYGGPGSQLLGDSNHQ